MFEDCSAIIFYTSIKVTFLKVLDQKPDFENPCCVAKPTGQGFKAVNPVLLTARPSVFIYVIVPFYLN